MNSFLKFFSKKAGLPPGTPVYVGDKKVEKVRISVADYDRDNYEIKEVESVEECIPYKDRATITWINITGLHEVNIVERLGECFGLHPLVIEDIVHTGQRPKIDIADNYIFIVLQMNSYDNEKRRVVSEQVSVVFGKNFVLTFQEMEGDVFESVRIRLKNSKGRIRKAKADYLAYALMDAVVDNYFNVLEGIGGDIEDIEDEVVSSPSPETTHKIHGLKREVIHLRKSVWPLREVINLLARDDNPLIEKTTRIYLRDLYDHTIQVIDTVETYRDLVSGMLDIYLSSISNKMNEIMKVLTIYAAIFIPLTFIAGVYGMNFNPEASPFNMPELNWRMGYPFALGLMALVAVLMLVYFKRKKWL